MTSMERVLAAVTGQPADRRAFVPVLGLYGARLTGCPTERYFTDPAAFVDGQRAVREAIHPDLLMAPLAFAALGASFGGRLHHRANDVPQLKSPAVLSADEWDHITFPDVLQNPHLAYFHDTIRLMAAEFGRDIPIAMVIPEPAAFPELVMGLEGWLQTILFDIDTARAIMERLAPFYIRLVNSVFEDGATIVAMPSGSVSPAILPRELVSAFSRPIIESILAGIHGPVLIHNVGARLLPHLDLLLDLPSVVGFILDQQDPVDEARRIAGPGPVLVGGIDCTTLGRMSLDEITAHCTSLLHARSHDPRFMLGTSGPDVAWDTPLENILAMRHCVMNSDGGGS